MEKMKKMTNEQARAYLMEKIEEQAEAVRIATIERITEDLKTIRTAEELGRYYLNLTPYELEAYSDHIREQEEQEEQEREEQEEPDELEHLSEMGWEHAQERRQYPEGCEEYNHLTQIIEELNERIEQIKKGEMEMEEMRREEEKNEATEAVQAIARETGEDIETAAEMLESGQAVDLGQLGNFKDFGREVWSEGLDGFDLTQEQRDALEYVVNFEEVADRVAKHHRVVNYGTYGNCWAIVWN